MVKLGPQELLGRLELSEQKRIQLHKKLTQKTNEEEIPLWSMVDLMTLLLIFFFFFYATSIKETLPVSQHLAENSPSLQIEPASSYQEKTEAISSIEAYPPLAFAASQGKKTENPIQTIQEFREEVLETMDRRDRDLFSVTGDPDRLVFVLGERITFKEGEATLRESHQPIFARIAAYISSKPACQVVVSGHTDTKPIRTAKYPSNLDLSAARAITVAKFLIENGVGPQRVSIQGFSEYRPLHANISPENREKNRRVEIALINKAEMPK